MSYSVNYGALTLGSFSLILEYGEVPSNLAQIFCYTIIYDYVRGPSPAGFIGLNTIAIRGSAIPHGVKVYLGGRHINVVRIGYPTGVDVQPTSPVRLYVCCNRTLKGFSSHYNWFTRRLKGILTLWHPRSIQPRNCIPDFEAGVLYTGSQPMIGAGTAEG